MAQTASGLNHILTRYLETLNQMGIRVERVYLYGSQARGEARIGSDIDLIVVSPDWAGYSLRERLEILGVAAARILEPIQAQGFTPNEIEQAQVPLFWRQILHDQAVEVYPLAS
ncbi:nucleotidyltransferase domain-containing protein [Thermanaerothrix sp. 4228-RoL]|uniref:Nucleotidyltransferase domain-containing protein n=1 Tax=Thermanaerothrix solaris TaxID=3058434 RepID=A0ABU3NNP2_9CHLR|nr:nucleotidyltransferase domain-containing protein [Thermanaerothrix sp. 4228-RoL]MDT8898459.1 nucleotidyltransferase domain-containing protein [Thermanaerothrix sp. 4228-RoL]